MVAQRKMIPCWGKSHPPEGCLNENPSLYCSSFLLWDSPAGSMGIRPQGLWCSWGKQGVWTDTGTVLHQHHVLQVLEMS